LNQPEYFLLCSPRRIDISWRMAPVALLKILPAQDSGMAHDVIADNRAPQYNVEGDAVFPFGGTSR
jgi:hypothetical protein